MTDAVESEMRTELRPGDEQAVRAVVASTGFFSAAEQDIAVELVETRRAQGESSGYLFVFLDQGPALIGYACFGPIPATRSSYDLYWIAVDAGAQRRGIGRRLLRAAEQEIGRRGGTRVYVDTSSRGDYAPTRAFYSGQGYSCAAELPDFYAPGDGKVVFCKVLV